MPSDGTPSLLDRAESACVNVVRPSPNHGERRGGCRPDCLVLHYTGMADGASAVAWLCNPASQVSSHYVVEEDGRVLQLVAEERRAWHAGRGSWQGDTDLNSLSIGIEIVNAGHPGGLPSYPDPQIDAVIGLSRDILARHAIPAAHVLAHSDIAPGRKLDPGERFPWQRLAKAGVGLWVPQRLADPQPVPEPERAALQGALRSYGYGLAPGADDVATATVVRAFQLHFRPDRVDGIADPGTVATLDALLAARGDKSPSA